MPDFVKEGFYGDTFTVGEEKVKASHLLGYGYVIPDMFWSAEEILPRTYSVENLGLRRLGKADWFVSWPEVDMKLNMEAGVIPVGWRLISYLYHHQECIPLVWLEYMLEGNPILFPYTPCYARKGSTIDPVVYCAAFFYDTDVNAIEFLATGRYAAGGTLAIGVYTI